MPANAGIRMLALDDMADRAAMATLPKLGRAVGGLSDRAIAWTFIAPTMILLLAINIFPLLWTIYLSFTNYASNRPNRPIVNVGLKWYRDILGSPEVWAAMQATAHFVFWTILFQTLIGALRHLAYASFQKVAHAYARKGYKMANRVRINRLD